MKENQRMDYDFYKAMENGKITEKLFHRSRVKNVLKAAQYDNKSVLEIGCGTGVVLLNLSNRSNVVGLDISPITIKKSKEYCKEKNLNHKVLIGDANHLSFRAKTFDTVLLIDVLEHFTHPENVIAEVKRVLKPGGEVIVTVPWRYHPVVRSIKLKKLLTRRQNIDDMEETNDEPYTLGKLKLLFDKNEFKFIKSWHCAFFVDILAVFKRI